MKSEILAALLTIPGIHSAAVLLGNEFGELFPVVLAHTEVSNEEIARAILMSTPVTHVARGSSIVSVELNGVNHEIGFTRIEA